MASFSTRCAGIARAAVRIAAGLVLGAAFASAAVAQSTDLVLQHQDSPDPGPAGGIFTYTLEITNFGPSVATGVVLTDGLPAGSFFQSVSTSPGAYACTAPPVGSSGTVACTIGTMALNATAIVTVEVELPTAGTYVNNASVTSTTTDANPANNTFAQTTTAVAASDISLAVVTSNPTPAAGASYTYTLTATNGGPNALDVGAILRISFTVPTGASYTDFSGSGYTCVPGPIVAAGTPVTCSRSASSLGVGASAPGLVITSAANAAGAISANFSASATKGDGSSAMPDGDLSNNTASATVTAASGTDVSVTQTVGPSPVGLGNNTTFTITPRFNGGEQPGAGGNIVVTNTLTAGLTYVSAVGSGWICTAAGQVVTCTRPGPYTGGNYTNLPTITLIATANAVGSQSNQAVISLTAGAADSVPGNDASTQTVTSSNDADLGMNKSVSFNPVVVGQAFNFSLSVTNFGILPVGSAQTIAVTDVLPPSITLTSAPSGSGWVCSPTAGLPAAGATVSCTRTGASLASGATTSSITVPVIQTAAGTVTNMASVALTGPGPTDPNSANDVASRDSLATGAAASIDLQLVSKTASAATTVSGQTLTYTIQVRNNAATTATNVVVTDNLSNLLPAGGLVSAVATSGTCSPTSGNGPSRTVTCNVGSLAQNGTATVTITVRPVVATDSNVTNTASVSTADFGDTDRTNNSGSVTTAVTAIVDIRASKTATPSTATPGTVPAGAPLTYTVTVINDGPSTAQAVTMTDTLPTNAAFISVDAPSSGGTCTTVPAANAVGGTLVCGWASIPTGQQRTVTYRVRPLTASAGSNLVNNVVVGTTTPETNTTNNSATTTTAVTPAQLDILVNKVDSTDPVPLGSSTTYTVTITNNGPSYGTNVVLTDVYPAPATTPTAVFSYRGALTVNTGGTCTEPVVGATNGTISCAFPLLAPNQTATVTYQMRADALTGSGANSGTLSSRASVTVTEPETQLANNAAIENTTTNRAAIATDMQIVKTAGAGTVSPGGTLIYTLVATNNGPAASIGAQVIDTLPAGLTLVSAPSCTAGGQTVTCDVGNLAPGASRTFTVTTTLASSFSGSSSLANTATVDAPGDTVPANNTSTITTTVSYTAVGIPTLSQWGLLLMAALLVLLGWRAAPATRPR